MKKRSLPYAFIVTMALLLTTLPYGIFFDYSTPLERFENWYGTGGHLPPGQHQVSELPFLIKCEFALFDWLVIPPGYLAKLTRGYGTTYAFKWTDPGVISEAAATFPPIVLFLDHAKFAFPLWSLVMIVFFESSQLLGRRRGNRAARA